MKLSTFKEVLAQDNMNIEIHAGTEKDYLGKITFTTQHGNEISQEFHFNKETVEEDFKC